MSEMIHGIVVNRKGNWNEVELRVLEDYQDSVEGDIEAVPLQFQDDRLSNIPAMMWVNDSFLLGQFDIDDDFNEIATAMAYVGGRPDLRLLGNVLITGGPDGRGETVTVPKKLIYQWLARVQRIQVEVHRNEN